MNGRREILIQLLIYPFLLLGCSALWLSNSYGGFSFERLFSTFIAAATFQTYYTWLLIQAALPLVLYNVLAGLFWSGLKLGKRRKDISFKRVARTFPIQILILSLIPYGLIKIGLFVDKQSTQELITSLFSNPEVVNQSEYEVRFSHPLNSQILGQEIEKIQDLGDSYLIGLKDGTTLIAVINENKQRIVFAEN